LLGPEQTTIKGEITFDAYQYGQNVLRGINFDISAMPTVPDRILTAITGIGELTVENCYFYREGTDYKRLLEIVRFAGNQQDAVVFNNCRFHGIIYNDFNFDVSNEYEDGNVIITNTVGSETYM